MKKNYVWNEEENDEETTRWQRKSIKDTNRKSGNKSWRKLMKVIEKSETKIWMKWRRKKKDEEKTRANKTFIKRHE